MQVYVDRLQRLGIDASTLRLPRGAAERAMRSLRDQVGKELTNAVIGGHSYGGRVASMVAAESPPAGLVLMSYPLHRPGHPAGTSTSTSAPAVPSRSEELRADHWSEITCPVLLLSGDRDQFARVDLLQASAKRLPRAELHIYPGMGHGLKQVVDDVASRIAAFTRGL